MHAGLTAVSSSSVPAKHQQSSETPGNPFFSPQPTIMQCCAISHSTCGKLQDPWIAAAQGTEWSPTNRRVGGSIPSPVVNTSKCPLATDTEHQIACGDFFHQRVSVRMNGRTPTSAAKCFEWSPRPEKRFIITVHLPSFTSFFCSHFFVDNLARRTEAFVFSTHSFSLLLLKKCHHRSGLWNAAELMQHLQEIAFRGNLKTQLMEERMSRPISLTWAKGP